MRVAEPHHRLCTRIDALEATRRLGDATGKEMVVRIQRRKILDVTGRAVTRYALIVELPIQGEPTDVAITRMPPACP